MNFTRRKRIALELLGPPLVGTALLATMGGIAAIYHSFATRTLPDLGLPFLQAAATVLIFSYLIAGVPSIIYTCTMEWRFSRGLPPDNWRMVRFSSLLGFLSGAAIVVSIAGLGEESALLFYGSIGTGVGFLLGWLIKVCSAENDRTGNDRP
jgi:hypothetical protein